MLFNSVEFLVFFVIVTVAYFGVPWTQRNYVLLLASCYFYCAFIPRYLLVLVFLILLDFSAALLIERFEGHQRKVLLLVSLAANIGVLGYFKYYNFFLSESAGALSWLGLSWRPFLHHVLLPIGLSFHTFQSMSYTIEVYRRRYPAERNLLIYSLYVLFYPQMVAGPIERPHQLLPQFREHHKFEMSRVIDGLALMAWGFFKKVCVADRLALLVNQVYGSPHSHTGVTLLVATYFFAIQIYCDFSGYSDIAIGAAQVMGFRLIDNFNRPYVARSVSEFWRRWHISLSTWFRDYVYIPLGGNRVSVPRQFFNLMLVFMVSGLWHGANWTFIIWGALHGAYLIMSKVTENGRERFWAGVPGVLSKVRPAIQMFITFQLVSLAWIFFRADSLSHAYQVVRSILTGAGGWIWTAGEGFGWTYLASSLAMIGIMEAVHHLAAHGTVRHLFRNRPFAVRWTLYYGLALVTLAFGMFRQPGVFLYFQF